MNNNFFLSASPGSASRTLLRSIEKSINKKSIHLKSSSGIGNLIINLNLRQKILFKLNKKLFLNKTFLFYQHLFPTYYNLYLIDKYIGPMNFIITYRNIFEQIKYLKKINYDSGVTPLSLVSFKNQSMRIDEREDFLKKTESKVK